MHGDDDDMMFILQMICLTLGPLNRKLSYAHLKHTLILLFGNWNCLASSLYYFFFSKKKEQSDLDHLVGVVPTARSLQASPTLYSTAQ
jgi:hypothetical protein